MKKIFVLTALIALLMAGCGGIGPTKYTIDRSVDYDADYDKVWAAVIEIFAEESVPVDNLEKASGYISTREFRVPDEYADSGKTPIGVKLVGPEYGTFNVFVKQRATGGCSVQVNCLYRLETDNMYYKSSESTGVFETKFHEALKAKLDQNS